MKKVVLLLLPLCLSINKNNAWTISKKKAVGCSVGAAMIGASTGYLIYTKLRPQENKTYNKDELGTVAKKSTLKKIILACSLMATGGVALGLPTYLWLIRHTNEWRENEIAHIINYCEEKQDNFDRVIQTNPMKAVKGCENLLKQITHAQNYLDELYANGVDYQHVQESLVDLAQNISFIRDNAQNTPYYAVQAMQKLESQSHTLEKQNTRTNNMQKTIKLGSSAKKIFDNFSSKE